MRKYLSLGRLDFTPPFRLLIVSTTLVLFAFEYSNFYDYAITDFETTASKNQASQEIIQYLGAYL